MLTSDAHVDVQLGWADFGKKSVAVRSPWSSGGPCRSTVQWGEVKIWQSWMHETKLFAWLNVARCKVTNKLATLGALLVHGEAAAAQSHVGFTRAAAARLLPVYMGKGNSCIQCGWSNLLTLMPKWKMKWKEVTSCTCAAHASGVSYQRIPKKHHQHWLTEWQTAHTPYSAVLLQGYLITECLILSVLATLTLMGKLSAPAVI